MKRWKRFDAIWTVEIAYIQFLWSKSIWTILTQLWCDWNSPGIHNCGYTIRPTHSIRFHRRLMSLLLLQHYDDCNRFHSWAAVSFLLFIWWFRYLFKIPTAVQNLSLISLCNWPQPGLIDILHTEMLLQLLQFSVAAFLYWNESISSHFNFDFYFRTFCVCSFNKVTYN